MLVKFAGNKLALTKELCQHLALSENCTFGLGIMRKKNSDIIPPSENNHLDEAQVKKSTESAQPKTSYLVPKKNYEGYSVLAFTTLLPLQNCQLWTSPKRPKTSNYAEP